MTVLDHEISTRITEATSRDIADTTSEFYRLCLARPELFAIHALGVSAWEKHADYCADQITLFRSIFNNRRTAAKSGHKTGKTFTLAAAALTFLHLYVPSIVITTAPTARQVEKLLWQEIHHRYNWALIHGMPLGGEILTKEYRLGPNHFAYGFATDKTGEGVQAQGWSGENLLIIIDEAAGVPKELWDVANTALQTPTAHIVAVGNPVDPATEFHVKCCSDLWTTLTMSSLNSPNCKAGWSICPGTASKEWCAEMESELGADSPQYAFRVLGEFPEASAFALITLDMCLKAAQKKLHKVTGDKVLGCDVARFGDDLTTVVEMTGGHITEVETHAKLDVVSVAGVCARRYRANKCTAIAIDDTGVGGGVVDILSNNEGINVIPVNFGARSFEPVKYADMATEMFASLAASLKDGVISGLPTGKIVQELTTRQYKFTPQQQMKLEPKDAFKKRIGRSPDVADGVMLANHARIMQSGGLSVLSQVHV